MAVSFEISNIKLVAVGGETHCPTGELEPEGMVGVSPEKGVSMYSSSRE